jgi:hypothetical protein
MERPYIYPINYLPRLDMYIDKETELAKVILDGNTQDIINVYSSKAFGWKQKCHVLGQSDIEDVVDSLSLNESDSAAIICSTLEAILSDIDEHEEYSGHFGNKEEIVERVAQLKQKITTNNQYEWEYLFQLAEVVQEGEDAFAYEALDSLTDPKQVDYLKKLDSAKRAERPGIIINTTDFSFMSPLLDEAVLATLSTAVRYGSSNFSEAAERVVAEESFKAFEYYVSKRPLPLIFGTNIINNTLQMVARWKNESLASNVTPFIEKLPPNVDSFTSLSGFYGMYTNRDKLIETLKLAEQFGADDSKFGWAEWADNPWEDDTEVQALIPKSIFDYPLDEE